MVEEIIEVGKALRELSLLHPNSFELGDAIHRMVSRREEDLFYSSLKKILPLNNYTTGEVISYIMRNNEGDEFNVYKEIFFVHRNMEFPL